MIRLYLAIVLILASAVPAGAYLLIGAQNPTPPPPFVMTGDLVVDTANEEVDGNSNGGAIQ